MSRRKYFFVVLVGFLLMLPAIVMLMIQLADWLLPY